MRILIPICLLVLASGTGCDSNSQQTNLAQTPQVTPAMVTHTGSVVSVTPTETWINVTRQQYEQALAQWRAQGIDEYKLQVEYWAYSEFMGIWTVDVRTTGNDSQVLDYTREAGLDAPVGLFSSQGSMPTTEEGKDYVKEHLKFITIEGQFANIEEILNWRGVSYYTTTVFFDMKSGNPTHVNSDPVPGGSEPSSWSLKSLKVLKQNKLAPVDP